MRIGIDNISPGEATNRGGPGGMRMYLKSLLKEFSAQRPQHEFVVFTPAWADPLLETQFENVRLVRLCGVPVNRIGRVLYQQAVLPVAVAREHVDVFFATATVAPVLAPVPIVLAVQFLQFYRWQHSFGPFRRAYLKAMLPMSAKKAKKAIIFTESAREDLENLAGVPAGKIEVVPHGLGSDVLQLAELRPDVCKPRTGLTLTDGRPYILYVSATYGYKNHARLIQAFALLKQRMNTRHVLLLVGDHVTVSLAELRNVAELAGVADQVIFVGRVESHQKVIDLYQGADLFAFPSLYETFGFPPLEAMACGCPVVASNVGSVAELARGAAVLVDPLDPNAIMEGMASVLEDPAMRLRLIERGRERVKPFTWQACARRTLEILELASVR